MKTNKKYDSFGDFDAYVIKYASSLIVKNRAGRKLLELGCGEGVMTQELIRDFDVIAVDGWKEGIKRMKKKLGSKVEAHLSLFEEFEPKKTFSDIVLAHVLEHVANPTTLLKKTKDWLSPGGRIHIVIPNGNSLHRHVGVELGLLKKHHDFTEKDKAAGHRRVYLAETLRKDIEKIGLKLIHAEGVLLKPLSSAQMLKFPPKLIWAFIRLGKKFPEIAGELYVVCKR